MHREQILIRLRAQRRQSVFGRDSDLRAAKVKLTQTNSRWTILWRKPWRDGR